MPRPRRLALERFGNYTTRIGMSLGVGRRECRNVDEILITADAFFDQTRLLLRPHTSTTRGATRPWPIALQRPPRFRGSTAAPGCRRPPPAPAFKWLAEWRYIRIMP